MLSLKFNEWREELAAVVRDVHGITLDEFIDPGVVVLLFRQELSPIEAFEEIEEEYYLAG